LNFQESRMCTLLSPPVPEVVGAVYDRAFSSFQ